MVHLQELYAQFKDKGLVILGFDFSDDKNIVLDFTHDNGITFPMVVDSSDAARKVGEEDYRKAGDPTNYIIDRDGKIVDGWDGWFGRECPRAKAALEKLGIK